MQAAATKTREEALMTAEFLMAYLLSVNQLNEIRLQVRSASNEQERRTSQRRLQNVRQRCNLLRSLVLAWE